MLAGGLVSPYARGAWVVRGNPLYVNSGLGLSGIPLRFRARPEVVLFPLQAPPPGSDPATNPFVLDEVGGSHSRADRRRMRVRRGMSRGAG